MRRCRRRRDLRDSMGGRGRLRRADRQNDQPLVRIRLEDLDRSSTLLDVGIGTATALRNNKAIVEAKDLRVAGIDYDARYIKAAERRVAQDAKLKIGERGLRVGLRRQDRSCRAAAQRRLPTRPTSRAH